MSAETHGGKEKPVPAAVLDGAHPGLFIEQAGLTTRSWYVFILIFIILAAGIITAGYLYYNHYKKNYRAEVQRQLSVISDLKVNGIMNWRKERLSDASLFYRNENFYARVQHYFERPGDADAKERLLTWLRQLWETHQYDRVCVLDVDGRPRISVPGGPGKGNPILSQAVAGLLRTGQITFEDFSRNENDGRIYLAVLVPVLDKDNGSLPIGVLVLHIDPEAYLYSLIKQWPAPSRTAETLLVRMEGNDVLFLNELRFKQNSALTLRRPLTQKALPSVQAVLGREGIVEGRDYRDIHVLANLRAVPGSPWFLVAKMDISEVYGPLNERLWIMIGFVVVLLLGSGAGVGLVWRQHSAIYYRQRYEAAEALRESEERFRLLVEGVRDYAIVMLDPSGNVMTWNQGAERIKGYREEEIIGRNFACFYPVEDLAQGKHLLALQEASSGGQFEGEGWRLRKDGSRFWANVLITALKDGAGRLSGFSEITRDISEHRLEQQEREITIEFLRLVNDSTGTRDLVQAAATFFQQKSGCEAIGVRLHDGGDYPYYEAKGFPKEFVLMENSLCARDKAGRFIFDETGNPVIECMCGNVIRGRFDPSKPFFTANGSFWTNNTTELLRSTTDADRQSRTRNRCNGEGYESVALLPLRLGEQRLGLLQLNDRRKGVFSAETIASWERLADYLAVALAKFRTEEALQSSEHRYRSLFDNMLEGFAYCRMLYVDNRPQDFIYLAVNGAFESLTGLKDVAGKKVSELIPGIREDNPELFEIYGRVIATGKPERFETYSESFGGWLYISVYNSEKEHFVTVFDNITGRKQLELSLKEEKTFTENALNVMKDLFFVIDLEGGFLRWNRTFEAVSGYSHREIALMKSADFFREADIDSVAASMQKAQKNGSAIVEAELVTKAGRHIPYEFTGSLLMDTNGNPRGISGVGRDISERKLMESLLQESEAKFRDLADKSVVGIYLIQDGIFRYVNTRLAETFGYIVEELTDKKGPEDLVLPEDWPIVREKLQKRITGEMDSTYYGFRGIKKNKKVIDLEVYGSRTVYKARPAVIGTLLDITERKQSEKALRDSEEKYRNLVDNAPVGIYKATLNGDFLYVNKALATMFEFASPEEMMSESVSLRYKNNEDRMVLLNKLKRTGKVEDFELDTLSKTGKAMQLLIRATLEGDTISGMVLNITEQKKLESQLLHAQKMEAIGTLAGGIAHDFNNILNVIIGYGTMVQDGVRGDQTLASHMNEVLAAAERAANLTKRLLAFSRKQAMETRPVNVNETILGLEKMLSRIIGEDILFSTELADRKITVMADHGQIEQVLMNLASNARDAMPKGGKLTISTGIRAVDHDYVATYGYGKTGTYALISVTDTGSGMDAETQKKIFEPFFTTKGVGAGTGLGLAMAYGIIKRHNGYINVYSEEGKGTTFKILLPLIEGKISKGQEVERVVPIKGGKETILVAEDDASLRKLERITLETFGYTVITAENGEDAIVKFMENRDNIQLVILDMIMPEKNGKEAYEEISRICPDVRTLFASGYTMDMIHKKELLDEGMDFILKPVSPNDLLKKVREMLDK